MPELPDVEVFRRRLDAHGLRREIASVQVRDRRLLQGVTAPRLREALEGRRLQRTARHGKHLFAQVPGAGWLVLHFGMTGRLEPLAKQAGDLPRHTRVVLRYAGGSALAVVDQRRLGFVSLTDDPGDYGAAQRLGPDALSWSFPRFRDAVCPRTAAVKTVLMDQSVMAGIGNVYSDEILFHARVDPRAAPQDLDEAALRRLHRQVGRVLRLAADREADPEQVPASWLLPHREDGVPCPRGNGTIRKLKLSGRGAFYCPSCQRSGAAR